jgi:hypothetical protein
VLVGTIKPQNVGVCVGGDAIFLDRLNRDLMMMFTFFLIGVAFPVIAKTDILIGDLWLPSN